jgi:50S ribosomal subunit-associated GTPase HflX
VEDILADLGLEQKPRLTLLNKIDILPAAEPNADELGQKLQIPAESVLLISASKGTGLEQLLQRISEMRIMSKG